MAGVASSISRISHRDRGRVEEPTRLRRLALGPEKSSLAPPNRSLSEKMSPFENFMYAASEVLF